MRDVKTILANLPESPGVYQMIGQTGQILYVGKAKNLKKRVTSYFTKRAQDKKSANLVEQIHDIEITVTHHENEAVLLECNLIKKHQPRYNVLLRDDKSYPYIHISTDHAFPAISLYRGKKKKGQYFGPYPSAKAVRETINLLQKLFRIRTCRDSYYESRTRPCLLYQIGRCSGPCVGHIDAAEYARHIKLAILFLEGKQHEVIHLLQQRMEKASQALNFESAADYRDKIARLRQMQEKQYVSNLQGNIDVIAIAHHAGVYCIQLLTIRNGQLLGSRTYYPATPSVVSQEEIVNAFLSQHYVNHPALIPQQIVISQKIRDQVLLEKALTRTAKKRVTIQTVARSEKKELLSIAVQSAKESLMSHLYHKTNMKERFLALQQLLNLPQTPRLIMCFDVSHTMGEMTVASSVAFDEMGPVKSEYRRFNIHGIASGDDIAATRQVLLRRFKKLIGSQATMPDIIFIDGGRSQVNAASEVLSSLKLDILLIGISKGPSRKPGTEILHFIDKPVLHLPADSLALHLIQHIRDEAHRFAITHHRHKRDKARTQSTLEKIPGIGAKRRRELLRYFGGIVGLSRASLSEIMKVPGINRSLAERLFSILHHASS